MRERLTQTGEATAGEDQNRRDRGQGGGGCSGSSSTWRLIVREVSREPGPDRAAAANPDQRGERGNWHRLLAAAPVSETFSS